MFDTLENLGWTVLLLPLVAAVSISLFTLKNKTASAFLSIAAVSAAFLISLVLFAALPHGKQGSELAVSWLSVGDLKIDIGLRLDVLSMMMTLVVTGVAMLIHIYSVGYMKEDECFSRFFASLSLFTFSMLGIVLSNNFLQMFIFWELVGVSSYLLIGFWHEKASAADAAKKAFLTNRLGDFGFLLGIILVWSLLGSLNFAQLEQRIVARPEVLGGMATIAGVLIFCGAMGKSAQFPLHVWLPDAMEGPTPVSALIHAATMVAAGVYMLCRVYFILNVPGSHALEVIAWIGGFTALLAALMAVQQNDIKRILAYSTLSQLGYMVMAVGLQGPSPAMFHLTTHAFFKAMLFLGAGSVIHALHHEQDIWKMGGLKAHMPVTYWTFFIGTLALCGVPPFAGFYSKDAILAAAAHHNSGLFVVGVLVAVLTTFYMFRLLFVAFLGQPRSEASGHAHESPKVMTTPLLVLAVPSVIAGFIGLDHLFLGQFNPDAAAEHLSLMDRVFEPFSHSPLAAVASLGSVLAGLIMAYTFYGRAARDPLPDLLGFFSRLMRNRFYFDEIYSALIACTQEAASHVANAVDRWIIAGLMVRGTHGTTELVGRALRLFQTGSIQTYAFLFAAGVAVVLLLALLP